MRRRSFIRFIGFGAFAGPFIARAQPPAKVYRIGFLRSVSASARSSTIRIEGLRAGLRDLGYIEGRNIVIEPRWAEGNYDRLPELAAELVRLNVDVIVTSGTPATLAAKQATSTIPIVVAAVGDAVAAGIVGSLARPGGNITGTSFFSPELMSKRLELLKEALPGATRMAFLQNSANSGARADYQAMETAAKALKVDLRSVPVAGLAGFGRAFAAMAEQQVNGVVIQEDSLLNANAKAVADLAAQRRLPAIAGIEFAEAGGLIGYGVDFRELFRRAAYFVDRILKGAKPGDLPMEQPTKFELIVNGKAGTALGIVLPRAVLQRADRIIE